MAKKLTLNATSEQIENLKNALRAGTPISIALQYAGISQAKYFYWVSIYSIVVAVKEQEEIESMEELAKSGVSVQLCRDLGDDLPTRKLGLGTFIEPSQESILQYKNSRKFKKFADECYEVVNSCNQIRSEVVINHLSIITKSTKDRKYRASGSMWYLERTLNEYFGKASDKAIEIDDKPGDIPPIQVEFVDPTDSSTKDRVKDMEDRVERELKGSGDA